jgi:hypothetical protein
MMSAEFYFGQLAGIQLSARRSALLAFGLVWAALAVLARVGLNLALFPALLGSFCAAILHWCSDLAHQLGHAWAARRNGYPMSGLCFWGVFSTCLYPQDEPELPARIHIRRALGGPITSLLLSILEGVLVIVHRQTDGVIWWVVVFFSLDNFLALTLGAFLPLGFTDGSTLLTWMGKR